MSQRVKKIHRGVKTKWVNVLNEGLLQVTYLERKLPFGKTKTLRPHHFGQPSIGFEHEAAPCWARDGLQSSTGYPKLHALGLVAVFIMTTWYYRWCIHTIINSYQLYYKNTHTHTEYHWINSREGVPGGSFSIWRLWGKGVLPTMSAQSCRFVLCLGRHSQVDWLTYLKSCLAGVKCVFFSSRSGTRRRVEIKNI